MRKVVYAINITLDGCCDHTTMSGSAPRAERSWHQSEGWQGSNPLGQLDADFVAARTWAGGDEVVLLVDPVLLGKGKRLFGEGTPPRAFTLERTQAVPSGIVINTFRPAGPLKNLK